MPEADIYRRSREATSSLFAGLDPGSLASTVPETPAWTVRDVLGHLVGGLEDHLSGNDEGAPGPEWTAAHVRRLAGESIDDLVGRWSELGPRIEERIEGEPRAWTFVVHDVWCHEHDVRSTVGAPRRDDDEARRFSAGAVWALLRRCEKADLPVPEVVVDDEVLLAGSGGPTVRFPDLHEVGRALFGRRSESQLRGYEWSGDPDPYLPLISFFALPAHDLHG